VTTIRSITLAATNVDEMVAFYNTTLGTNLKEMEPMPSFYMGKLAGHGLIVCPNEVAAVVAEQNRQQFCFEVTDIEKVFEAGKQNGGEAMTADFEKSDLEIRGWLKDPDGNTLEFVQTLS